MSNKQPENKTYYMPICMCIGISLGMTMGSIYDNMLVGMCIGLAIGVGIGALLDNKARKK